MAAPKLPFTAIRDLPPAAQKEIRRNFEELVRSWPTSSPSVYDGIIDPSATSSSLATGIYKNVGDWVTLFLPTSSRQAFTLGVLPTGQVTETANISVSVSLTIEAVFRPKVVTDTLPSVTWDLAGHSFTVNAAGANPNMTRLRGLTLYNSSGAITTFVSGGQDLVLEDCVIPGGNSSSKITKATTGRLYAYTTTFEQQVFTGIAILLACHYLNTGSVPFSLSTSDFIWVGGTFTTVNGSSGVAITLGGTNARCVIEGVEYDPNTAIGGGVSGVHPTFTVANTGTTRIRFLVGATAPNVSVATTAGPTIVEGEYHTVTFSANTTPTERVFRGAADSIVDISGPAVVDLDLKPAGSCIFRGSGVRASVGGVSTTNTGTPAIQLLSATDSLVTSALAVNSIGKPYAIDSGSARSILVITGSNAGWSTVGTNASTTAVVIDENFATSAAIANATRKDLVPTLLEAQIGVTGPVVFPPATGSTPTGAAGGSLAGTFPNPTFAGRTSSVDELDKDITMARVFAVNGTTVYPPATGSTPTGAAGGSLAGTFPNPTFAGRTSSVDELDKDITMAVLFNGG